MGEDLVPQTRRRRTRTPLWEPSGFWDRPPGWVFHSAVLVLALWSLKCASIPGLNSLDEIFAVLAWLAIASLWIGRVTVYGYRLLRRDRDLVAGSRWWWSAMPAAAVLTLSLVASGLPMQLRFLWSRAALDRLADAILASPEFVRGEDGTLSQNAVRAGLFDVEFLESAEGGARFLVAGASCGFARFHDGPPAPSEDDSYYSLEDDWYLWLQHFDD